MAYSQLLDSLLDGSDASAEQMTAAVAAMFEGRWSEAQSAAFLAALRAKGETAVELAAAAAEMRKRCTPVAIANPEQLVDTCGTGGDGARTFNISTAAAFIAAACGVRVAKHGNRAQSGVCGSSDLLARLGTDLEAPAERCVACFAATGICFMFAPAYHPAARSIAPVRQQLGVRTLFNLIGPLANPAGARRQLAGVFSERWLKPYAQTLALLGSRRALVVAADGLDEFSISGPSVYAELTEDGQITHQQTEPARLGYQLAPLSELQVANPEEAEALFRTALDGSHQAASDAATINAGAAIYLAGLAATHKDGCDQARAAVAAGSASAKLAQFIDFARAA